MNNVVKFLEELGKANNIKLEGIDIEALLENEDFDAEVKQALMEGDNSALETLLQSRSKIVCMIIPAEPEKEDEDDKDDDNDDDDSEKSYLAVQQ